MRRAARRRATASGRLLAAVALVAAGAMGVAAFVRQQPVFRVNIDRVRLDALVTADGRPIAGLAAADFEVLDNGVPQKVDVATTAGDVTVVLVLDTSGSVEGPRLEQLVKASQSVLGLVGPGDTMSLITFADRMALSARSARDPAALRATLADAQALGRTAMWDALFAGLAFAARDAGRSLVMLFTDGVDNASWLSEKQLTDSLKRAESVVYAVCPVTFDIRSQNRLRNPGFRGGHQRIDAHCLRRLSGFPRFGAFGRAGGSAAVRGALSTASSEGRPRYQ